MQLWREKRYILERIVRTETINTYAKVQLQEWYDQGVREVERFEVNDLRSCDLCRTLALPGSNVFLIEDLLNDTVTKGYPVTFMSHPNCRGGYRPRINLDVFTEFENKVKEFQNSQDIEAGDSKAENVPIEYQEQVEKALSDFGPEYGIKFVPEITEDPEWQEDRLAELSVHYNESEAISRLELEKQEKRGNLVQYTTRSGRVLISGDAGDINRVVIPVLRDKAQQVWALTEEGKREWVEKRYEEKMKDMSKSLMHEGVEIFGDSPFVSPLAKESAEQYFVEAYTTYVADPSKLIYMDHEMYDFLKDNFMKVEYIGMGGVK
jgi:hypothetical protein